MHAPDHAEAPGASSPEGQWPETRSLVVSAKECAVLIGISMSYMQTLCAAEAWRRGDLPAPTYVGSGSGHTDRYGRRRGKRVWRLAAIEAWLAEHEWRRE